MAKFSVTGIQEQLDELSNIECDVIAPKMLEEAAPILLKNVKSRSASHHVSGQMNASIKTTKANRTGHDGYSITVRPTGKDEKGVGNMEKMAYLEYGTSKQSPTPVLTPAVRESEDPVLKKMQEVFDQEVDKK